ncbi:G-PROTEIN-RECEP-F1-2 domain-containing protein [Aphelenchoides bicaudatus]|nr:G-PROTEIN-RECEP-F1-2 domain-containing protein [Aphelenchoides bicaudatus]
MSFDDGLLLNFMDEDDAATTDADVFFNVNQTALSLLYEKIKTARACMEQDFDDSTRCEEGMLYKFLMGYAFLALCAIAVIGNILNILVYLSEQIRFFIAIRMLCTKLIVNTLTMLFLLPSAFRSINLWQAGDPYDQAYWKFWPYQAFFVNVFGFVGIWMSVLMTGECYIHIFYPLQSKLVCTKNNLMRSYLVISLIAILLAGIYPLNRLVMLRSECNNIIVTINVADSYFLGFYERFHMFFNLLLAILLPLLLLILMSAAIVYRLNTPMIGKASSASNSSSSNVGRFGSEKRTVVRITLITTSLQLFSELPSVPVFVFATLFGPSNLTTNSNLCFWQTISQFVAMFNVSISFFTYLIFSPRFREVLVARVYGSAPQKSLRSSPSKRLSNTRLDEAHLLTPRVSSAIIQRNESLASADHFNNATTRYLSISSNATAVTNDVYSSISKASDAFNFL